MKKLILITVILALGIGACAGGSAGTGSRPPLRPQAQYLRSNEGTESSYQVDEQCLKDRRNCPRLQDRRYK